MAGWIKRKYWKCVHIAFCNAKEKISLIFHVYYFVFNEYHT